MAYDKDLANRIREALSEEQEVREVSMFGGLTFMVNGKMTATANTTGQLMVRCDPKRAEELLTQQGADWPEMRGKRMSKGWVVVDEEGTDADDDLFAWVQEAVDYNRKVTKR